MLKTVGQIKIFSKIKKLKKLSYIVVSFIKKTLTDSYKLK